MDVKHTSSLGCTSNAFKILATVEGVAPVLNKSAILSSLCLLHPLVKSMNCQANIRKGVTLMLCSWLGHGLVFFSSRFLFRLCSWRRSTKDFNHCLWQPKDIPRDSSINVIPSFLFTRHCCEIIGRAECIKQQILWSMCLL
jgi:hypothetical protein